MYPCDTHADSTRSRDVCRQQLASFPIDWMPAAGRKMFVYVFCDYYYKACMHAHSSHTLNEDREVKLSCIPCRVIPALITS